MHLMDLSEMTGLTFKLICLKVLIDYTFDNHTLTLSKFNHPSESAKLNSRSCFEPISHLFFSHGQSHGQSISTPEEREYCIRDL